MNRLFTIIILTINFFNYSLFAQSEKDYHEIISFNNDSALVILNDSSLDVFFDKLYLLENGAINQLNIVHIGNSHTQAGFITGEIRNILQNRFGNAGRGLVFPYKVANSNSPSDVYSFSNVEWDGCRNSYYEDNSNIGICGFLIETQDSNAVLKLSLNPKSNLNYHFNKLKIFHPFGEEYYDFSVMTSKERDILEEISFVIEEIKYQVVSGDYLGKIATKFSTSVSQIKKLNGLKDDLIYPGQTLVVREKEVKVSTIPNNALYNIRHKKLINNQFTEITLIDSLVEYIFLKNIKNDKSQKLMRWDGIVLENTFNTGVLYHMIGVNGATYDDYNNTEIFFNQLPHLNPDLVIVSLGTNESFEDSVRIINSFKKFYNNIKLIDENLPFILWIPAESEKKSFESKIIADSLILYAEENNIPYFDLFNILGGRVPLQISKRKKMAKKDKVHFTAKGYMLQGRYFSHALLKSYRSYKATIDD